MGVITLHRIVKSAANWTPGDISIQGAMFLWNDIRREGLDRVFFHDGSVTDAGQWRNYVLAPGQWIHVVLDGSGQWLAVVVANGFTSSGNTAFSHVMASRYGRANPLLLREAAGLWFNLLREAGLRTLVGVMPVRYRSILRFAASLGYVEITRLPGALKLHKRGLPSPAPPGGNDFPRTPSSAPSEGVICDAIVMQRSLQ
jgi:hypothetical protein